jgi:hypothetical protein
MSIDNWMAAWAPMIAAVGKDFSPAVVAGADTIEAGAVRRYLEPLEFDCPLHTDAKVARAHGYDDIVLPCTALTSFALPPMRQPGDTLFDSAARDAQPRSSPVTGVRTGLEPPTTGFFATNYEVDYVRSAVVGDRLSRRGARLLACTPKETRVGRGAFVTWESEIINQRGETVARLRTSFFRYNPH